MANVYYLLRVLWVLIYFKKNKNLKKKLQLIKNIHKIKLIIVTNLAVF